MMLAAAAKTGGRAACRRYFAKVLTPSQREEVVSAARIFARRELVPLADELERTNKPVPHSWLAKYGEGSFLAINAPEEYGGLGLDHLTAISVLEEFAQVSSAVAFPVFECNTGPVKIIEHFGSAKLKSSILPEVYSGKRLIGITMSESGAGSALTDLSTTAVISGGTVTINGSKQWMSGAGHSDMVVIARFGNGPGASGLGAIYVPLGTDGVSFGAQEPLMGFRGIPSASITFDNVKVDIDNLLLPAGSFGKLMSVFNLERCGNATMALAQAQAALQDTIEYVQQRKQFGKPIIDFQAVQLRLADMILRVEASRSLIHRAISNADASSTKLPSAGDASVAKCFANEAAVEVTRNGMFLLGAMGYSTRMPAERRVRDALGWQIAGGTTDIQKINIAAWMAGKRFNQR